MSDTTDDLSSAKLKPGATLDRFNEAVKRGESGAHGNILVDNPGLVEDLAIEFYKCNENPKESPNLEVTGNGMPYGALKKMFGSSR